MNEMDRMRRARTLLLLHHPFFGYIAAKLDLVETDKVLSMATDCKRKLFFNPEFTKMLSANQTLTGVAHEVGHPVQLFLERLGARKKARANAAADHAWNLILKDSGFPALDVPGKFRWLCDDQYKGMNWEAIYDKLDDEFDGGYPGTDIEGESGGIPQDGDGPDQSQQPQQQPPINWKRVIVEAAHYARMKGNLPGGIEEMVDGIIHTKIPWEQIIHTTMSSARRTDWTYRRPNRRYAHQGIVMPIPFGYTTSVECWLDSSGSISPDWFKMGLGVCVDCAQTLKVPVNVGVCDTAVHLFERDVKSTDILKRIRFRGRGGTSFIPAFEHVKSNRRRPDALIYFTDLCGDFPDQKPRYPVLWCVPESLKQQGMKVPFGRILWVPEREK